MQHTHTHSLSEAVMGLCFHAGNSISWMGSPGSLPADITPPPAPRPSPLVQEDELLSNNHLPEHNNIVSTLQLVAHVAFQILNYLSDVYPEAFSVIFGLSSSCHSMLFIYGVCFSTFIIFALSVFNLFASSTFGLYQNKTEPAYG